MKKLGLRDAADLRHGHRPPRPDADQGVQRGRDPARHRAAQRRRHHHRPYRQPRHRPDELHRRRARRQRRRVGHGGGDRGGAGAVEAQIPRHHRLCRAVGRGAGAARRQDPRRLCQGAGLERHRQSEQRHHRQQLRLRRGVQRQAGARLLRRAALAGARGACRAEVRSLGGENDSPVAQHLALPRQRWPSACRRSASTSCRSGATTASAAAATIPSS